MQAVCQTPHKLQSFYAYLIDTDTTAAQLETFHASHSGQSKHSNHSKHSQACFRAFNIHSVVIRQFSQMVKLLAQWADGERAYSGSDSVA